MTLDDAINFFGNPYQIAKVCGFCKSAPYIWIKRGYIPMRSQLKIQKITSDKLIADINHCK